MFVKKAPLLKILFSSQTIPNKDKILIDCMTLVSPLLDVTRMSMSTVSFLTQLGFGILCQ